MKYLKTTSSKQQPVVRQKQVNASYQPTFDARGTPIRFAMTLQQSQSSTDATLLWNVMTPQMVPNRGNRAPVVIFRKSIFLLTNWVIDQLPKCIYISIDGINGFLDKDGNQTSRLARYELSDSVTTQQVPLTHDAKYQLTDDSLCQIPSSVTQLNFRVSFDDNTSFQALPLVQGQGMPLKLEFQRFLSANWKQNLRGQNDQQ